MPCENVVFIVRARNFTPRCLPLPHLPSSKKRLGGEKNIFMIDALFHLVYLFIPHRERMFSAPLETAQIKLQTTDTGCRMTSFTRSLARSAKALTK